VVMLHRTAPRLALLALFARCCAMLLPEERRIAELAACALRERRAIGREDLQLLPVLLHAAMQAPSASTYVELGGLDGITGSQTLVLEQCFQWSGMLIEANPSNYAAMTRCGRHQSRFLHSAVCSQPDGTLRVTAGGGAVSGVIGEMSRRFASKWKKLHTNATELVPCAPLVRLMQRSGFERTTYLSLDVEGAELTVLQTITTVPFPFSVVLVEADGLNVGKNAAVRALLRRAGLKQLALPTVHGSNNELFVAPDLLDLRPNRSEIRSYAEHHPAALAAAERQLVRQPTPQDDATPSTRQASCASRPTQQSCFYLKGGLSAERDDLALVMAGLSKVQQRHGSALPDRGRKARAGKSLPH